MSIVQEHRAAAALTSSIRSKFAEQLAELAATDVNDVAFMVSSVRGDATNSDVFKKSKVLDV